MHPKLSTKRQVYAKRPDAPDIRPYRERLADVRTRLAGLEAPHVWPSQRVVETERAACLLRQYLAANLAQRISSRPFLTLIEKVRACGCRWRAAGGWVGGGT